MDPEPVIRLGLCCAFIEAPIRFRTTTITYLQRVADKGENPLAYLGKIVLDNIAALEQSLHYCLEQKIFCFRINSAFMPGATHPVFNYRLQDLPEADKVKQKLMQCGRLAAKYKIRLTFHPDQFVVLNSPREDVVEKSVQELLYHAELAEYLGADVINIHGGGGYGSKKEALQRLEKTLERLPEQIKKRLTLENDDKIYTPQELLPLCLEQGIPLLYDVHHHRCLKDGLSAEEATQAALSTWNREPLFHISSPLEGWKGPRPSRHHDYIDPSDMPECWKMLGNLSIEVEAKAKELAVNRLRIGLVERGWPL